MGIPTDNDNIPDIAPANREPVLARIVQAVIISMGVMLLIAVVVPGIWGPLVVGIILLGSAAPPVRRYVDRWLTGQSEGKPADTATLFRVAIGAGIVVLAALGLLRF